MLFKSLATLAALSSARAYWLMGVEKLVTERADPIVSPGEVSGHVHTILGGSNFDLDVSSDTLRSSDCTSVPIKQDKSAYWFPHLYFQWNNGSFSSLSGGVVMYYLFDKDAGFKAFPDDFRMISGDPTRRTYDETGQVTHLCLNFEGVTTEHLGLPLDKCTSGVRSQINFPSCWDGENSDSDDHQSHVAFLSENADTGSCTDPKFPVRLPRIFMEVYWDTGSFADVWDQAKNASQPFVYSYGDRSGYGYHADFINGWEAGALQKAIDGCTCNDYGDPTCCADAGIFTYDQDAARECTIEPQVDEAVIGTFDKLPGNNPVTEEGANVEMTMDENPPAIVSGKAVKKRFHKARKAHD